MVPLQYQLGEAYRELPKFDPPLADSRDYPPATIRVVPSSVTASPKRGDSLQRDGLKVMSVDHGRTALYLIGQLLRPRRIWVPAYHCPAMVEPFIAAGCEIAFYPIDWQFEADYGFLTARVRPGDALLGVRFFGFDTGISTLAALCLSHDLLLIEDLAHAAYFDQLHGRFAVIARHKFVPVSAGGELLVREGDEDLARLERLHDELPSIARIKLRAGIKKLERLLGKAGPRTAGYRYFQLEQVYRGRGEQDKALLNSSDRRAFAQRRQENYRYLAEMLSSNQNGAVIFPRLPDHVVPYVLPFLLAEEAGFSQVRREGIQALRWEEMAPTDCEVSRALRTRLVQLPIHQELNRREFSAIVSALAG